MDKMTSFHPAVFLVILVFTLIWVYMVIYFVKIPSSMLIRVYSRALIRNPRIEQYIATKDKHNTEFLFL